MKKSRYSDNQILNILRTGFLLPLACGKIRNEDYDTEKCGCVLLLTLVKNGVITLLRLCMIARPDPFSPCIILLQFAANVPWVSAEGGC